MIEPMSFEDEKRLEFIKALLRLGAFFVSVPLFIVFVPCDYLYARDKVLLFLMIRMSGLPVFIATGILIKRIKTLVKAQILAVVFVFTNSIIITIMTFLSEGTSSPYYAGLNLVCLGVVGFTPWTRFFLVLHILAIYLPYYLFAFFSGGKSLNSALVINSFFMISTIFMTLYLRYMAEVLRTELSDKNSQLETAIKDLKKTQADLIIQNQMATLGYVSASISHELNNSLNYVSGALYPFEKIISKLDLKISDKKSSLVLLDSMKNGIELSLMTIKHLSNFSAKDGGKFTNVNLYKMTTTVLAILKSRTGQNHQVIMEIEKNFTVKGSHAGLVQIVTNLVKNALDSLKLNGGQVVIRAYSKEVSWFLEVEDTGCGIPDDIRTNIFEPFFTTKELGNGMGIGLDIVKTDVARHGGVITLESKVGKGTKFTIQFPVRHGELEKPREHSAA